MKSNLFMAASFLALTSIVGCSSSTNGSPPGGGTSGSCNQTGGGSSTVTYCVSYSNLTASEGSSLCSTGTAVSSCSTTNVAGTCAYTITSGSTTYNYDYVYYAVNGTTCATAKSGCGAITGGGITTTFTGNGC